MDDGAFSAGICGERKFLIAVAQKKLRVSRDVAEDLAQTAILKAWMARERYIDDGTLRAWLLIIMTNHFLSEKRRAWRVSFHDDMMPFDSGVSGGQESAVYLRQVLGAMLKLPLDQVDALILLARGYQYDQAGDMTDTKCGTVKSRIARARAALREAVG